MSKRLLKVLYKLQMDFKEQSQFPAWIETKAFINSEIIITFNFFTNGDFPFSPLAVTWLVTGLVK